MLAFRFPTWVYWSLALASSLAAGSFTLFYDVSDLPDELIWKMYFTIWGGPLILILSASLVTWLRSKQPPS